MKNGHQISQILQSPPATSTTAGQVLRSGVVDKQILYSLGLCVRAFIWLNVGGLLFFEGSV